MSYFDIYTKRINRYGTDYQSRILGQRERMFEDLLNKTLYKVTFDWDNNDQVASLERNRQDLTEITAYLLTRLSVIIPTGTILTLTSQNGDEKNWMIWWLEQIEQSGYNRYLVLKMDREVTWEHAGSSYSGLFNLRGPGNTKIFDTKMSGGKSAAYLENNNGYMIIGACNPNLCRDDYIEFVQSDIKKGFRVEEVDIVSTPGVGYYTLDPIAPKKENPSPNNNESSGYWLRGGN